VQFLEDDDDFGTAARRTVVVADDEPSRRLLVSVTIESNAYQVYEAGRGDEAWNLIQQYRPSLVILDGQMPDRGGERVLSAIKKDPELQHTRVILLTSGVQKAEVRRGLAARADFYLSKPFLPRDLLTLVWKALGRQRDQVRTD
jgi:CheY-like chemotaxis protein